MMRYEVFHNAKNNTVTVVDAPEGHEFIPPDGLGSSIGVLTTDDKSVIISKSNSLVKTWLTARFAMLGIEDPVETVNHLPSL